MAGAVSVALIAGVLAAQAPATASPMAPTAAVVGDQAPSLVTERPDAVTAQMSARAQGTRVEVVNARTSTSRTWANPDGSFSSDIYAGPNWTLNSADEWVEVDTRLSAGKDGSVRPAAAAVDVTVSGARDAASSTVATVKIAKADLVAVAAARTNPDVPVPASDSVSGAAASFSVGFDGALPTPVLSDNEARYVNVAAGRDLRVKVLPAGVESFVDLTSRPDSISKAGVEVALPLSVDGLAVEADGVGGLVFTDPATGKQVASTPPARIWDATKGRASGESEHGIVVATQLRKVESGGYQVVATVPASYFDTPGLVYPVTVDPGIAVDLAKDTFVEKGYDSTVFGSDPELKVGTYDSGTHVGRSYVMFTMSSAPLLVDTAQQSTVVDNAMLQLWLHHSASCTASLVGIKYLTGSFSETTTNWTNKPSQSASIYQVSDAKRDDSGGSCAEGWLDSSTGTETKDIVQGWVNGDYANYGYALGASETSSTGWKIFYSSDYSTSARRPKLTITYHHKPRTPSATTIAGQVAGTGKVGTLTPQIRAKVGDWDGGNVRAKVEVWHSTTMVWSGYTGYTASGSNTPWVTVGTALTNGNTYTVRTYGNDGSLTSSAYDSATFTVDRTKPAAPSVSSTAFPSSSWASADSGTLTFTDTATDTATWEWSTDGGTTWDAGTGGTSFTTPTVTMPGGWVDLKVRAIDATGNVSDPTTYSFGVPAVTKPTTEDSTARFMTLGASGPSTANNVTFQYKSDGGSTWADIPVAAVTLGGSAVTAWSTVVTTATTHTSDAPANLVWDMQATLGTDAVVGVRAVFKNGTSTVATSVNAASARLDSHAYGLTYATADTPAGPVSLLTGNLAVSGSDASVTSYGGGLAVSRTFNSDAPTYTPTAGPAFFGPGWSTTLASAESDWASAEDLGSQVRVTDSDGGRYYFQHTTGTSYVPVADAKAAGLKLKTDTINSVRAFDLIGPDGSTVYFVAANPTWGGTPSLSTPDIYRVDHTSSAGGAATSTYEYNNDGTPKALIAPHPTAVSCSSAAVNSGCRILAFTYADVDTGAGVANRLTTVTLKTKDTTGAAVNVDVACYTYDSGAGYRIHQVWDPRLGGTSGWSTTCGSPVQAVTYGYDGDGRITSITPAGLNATSIAYNATSHRLDHVYQSDGTNTLTTTIAYNAFDPTTATTLADRPDLSAATVATWGQTDLALAAAAVFGPGESASGTDLRAGTVYGIDAAGRIVNTAVYAGSGQGGWRIDTTEYDAYGNTTRTLTAAARDRALNPTSYSNELTDLGLSTSTPAVDIAAALDTRNTYSADGTDLLDTFGPARYTQLANGTTTVARPHTHNTYGAVDYPDTTPGTWTSGAPLHTLTATTESASLSLEPTPTNEADTTSTSYTYALSSGDHPGWELRQPMTTTVENGTTDITTTTRYDADGNVIEQRQPSAASGSDPGTRKTTYYAAGTHNPGACTSSVWYGQVCKIEPGTQPTTADMAQPGHDLHVRHAPAPNGRHRVRRARRRRDSLDPHHHHDLQELRCLPADRHRHRLRDR